MLNARFMMLRKWNSWNLGFSLIELLIILALIGILALLILPLFDSTITNKDADLFLEQFEQDFFTCQQLALAEEKSIELIFSEQGEYQFRYRLGEVILQRSIQKDMNVFSSYKNPLRINPNGNINQGGNIRFEYQVEKEKKSQTYIFQVASGRFRVEKK